MASTEPSEIENQEIEVENLPSEPEPEIEEINFLDGIENVNYVYNEKQ